MCRSSTAAEIQLACAALDGHEFPKQLALDFLSHVQLDALDACLHCLKSVIITDSKNMFDCVNRIKGCGLQLEEKRLVWRLRAAGVTCGWVNSDQQQAANNLSKAFEFEFEACLSMP